MNQDNNYARHLVNRYIDHLNDTMVSGASYDIFALTYRQW